MNLVLPIWPHAVAAGPDRQAISVWPQWRQQLCERRLKCSPPKIRRHAALPRGVSFYWTPCFI